mgnify:CR=1 FL=1
MIQILQEQFNTLKQDNNYIFIKRKVKFSYKKDLEKFIYYYNVWKYSENNSPQVEDISKRGSDFHLDHIIPINIGYKYNISPEIIGDLKNLRIISHKSNFNKAHRLTDEGLKLLLSYGIDFTQLTPIKREVLSEPHYKRSNNKICFHTSNPKSLFYYSYANKLRV